tara:strand:+ start:93 stop:755 length:663 start_codon:yes stop_codon:yes gene_type:complete
MYNQKKLGDNTRSSGIMKTKALSKGSMLFNLGKGSPAKVACGGVGQPACAEVEEMLNQVRTEGSYTNAQDINKIPTLTREEKEKAVAISQGEWAEAKENHNNSIDSWRSLRKKSSRADQQNRNSYVNYLRSVADRDRQLQDNALTDTNNIRETLSTADINNFTDANTTGRLKNENKKYLAEKYQEYLDKGTDFTSKVDFSTYQSSPKTIRQFINPTADKY